MMTFRPGQRLIIPGAQVFQPRVSAGANFTGVLDGISNLAAAYGLRKLRSAYSGSAVRVRRSSDSTEQDIGFDGSGEFDSAAFSSFVGGGTGYVKTWYDQSGNTRDATQATTGSQPSIVLSVVNSKPVLRFDGTDDKIAYASSVVIGSAIVLANHADATFGNYNGLITGGFGGNNQVGFIGTQSSTVLYVGTDATFIGKIRQNGVLGTSYATLTTHKITSGIYDDSADTWTKIVVGNDRDTAGRFWKGDTGEIILFSAAISTADHNTIGADMATRYGLSWTTVT